MPPFGMLAMATIVRSMSAASFSMRLGNASIPSVGATAWRGAGARGPGSPAREKTRTAAIRARNSKCENEVLAGALLCARDARWR